MAPTLPALRWPTYETGAVMLFALLGLQPVTILSENFGTPLIPLAWVALISAAWMIRRQPVALAGVMVAGSVLLRLGFVGEMTSDQILVSQAAWERVATGLGGPWGIGYANTLPPGSPFPYGPLALVWWIPGPIVEFAAALAIMVVLARIRAIWTLAVFAALLPSVALTVSGVNDYSPALLVLLGTAALRRRPLLGAAIFAVAAALKPYAFAWFLPVIGYGGLTAGAPLALVTALLWSPLLWWGGPAAFLESARMASAAHPISESTLNAPVLRWLAVPIALAGLLAKRWEFVVLIGAAAFAVFLFLDWWASYSYWLAIIPAGGMALESLLQQHTRWPVILQPERLDGADTHVVPKAREARVERCSRLASI